jgi:hypothetical protein
LRQLEDTIGTSGFESCIKINRSTDDHIPSHLAVPFVRSYL